MATNFKSNSVYKYMYMCCNDIPPSLPPLLLPPPHTCMCIHCQHLEPHFVAAAHHLLANDPPVLLGRVEAARPTGGGQEVWNIWYPLVFMFHCGRTYSYTGPREEDGMGRREIGMWRREIGIERREVVWNSGGVLYRNITIAPPSLTIAPPSHATPPTPPLAPLGPPSHPETESLCSGDYG